MKLLYSIYHFLWSLAGSVLYGFPSKKLRVIGVTGTKGKSTTLALLAHILSYAGKPAALLSSAYVQTGDRIERNQTGNSMPGRMFLHRFFRNAVTSGCEYALVEVTSQGIVQHRHRFISWNAAVFLDIHPEHIEAHGSFEKYLRAKISFFEYVAKKSGARKPVFFVNAEDAHAPEFVRAARSHPVTRFSSAEVAQRHISVPETLPGDFNKTNVAAACAVAMSFGISEEIIRHAIASFPGLLGRMTIVSKRPVYAVVDYAHTPDSLEAVYSFLRQRADASAALICVLGSCGGGRDKWKRPVMGSIAARYCSKIILTNEDPYDENPEHVLRQIRKGIGDDFKGDVYEMPDRGEAIKEAVSIARPGDTLVCTGKGSEQWIHAEKGKKIPWNESELVFCELNRQGKYINEKTII